MFHRRHHDGGRRHGINAFQFKTWDKFLLWIVIGLLYIVVGFVRFENPLRAAALLGKMLERVDGTLRQWPAAGISLLLAAIMFGAAMLAGR